jgi:hypothetical protein
VLIAFSLNLFNPFYHKIKNHENSEPSQELNIEFMMNDAVLVLELLVLQNSGQALDRCNGTTIKVVVILPCPID